MSVAPDHFRAARLDLPRLSLPAILAFAVVGFGGAIFLAYSTFSAPEKKHSSAMAGDVPVYEGRAVPLDPNPEDVAARTASIARAITATAGGLRRSGVSDDDREAEQNRSKIFSADSGELRGFSRFAVNSGVANNYLTLTGTAFGMGSHMAPSGDFASGGEFSVFAPVPEPSTWLCGAALLALVVARGLHASWYRHQRRSSSKNDPIQS